MCYQESHIWDKLNFRAIKIIITFRTHNLETLVMLLIDTFLVICFSVYLDKYISCTAFMTFSILETNS